MESDAGEIVLLGPHDIDGSGVKPGLDVRCEYFPVVYTAANRRVAKQDSTSGRGLRLVSKVVT